MTEESYATARQQLEQAWSIYREIGDRHWRTYVAPRLARALLAFSEIGKAQQILEEGADLARAIDGQPNLQSILWLLAQILEEKEDFAIALGPYNELLDLAPDDSDYLRGRARVRLELKNYARALSDYQHLIKLNAQDARAYNGIGSVLEKEDDLEGAVAAYSQAIAIDANEAAFVRNRAGTLIALGRLEQAREDCETVSRLAPEYPYTQGRWGDLHLARGEWAEAETRYRAALAQDDSPGWRLDLAVSLWGLGRLDEGWIEFEAALEKVEEETRTSTLKEYQRLLTQHPTLPCIAEAIERLTKDTKT